MMMMMMMMMFFHPLIRLTILLGGQGIWRTARLDSYEKRVDFFDVRRVCMTFKSTKTSMKIMKSCAQAM